MREPERIHRVLLLLQEAWSFDPDMRFGQLLTNIGYFKPVYGATMLGHQELIGVEDPYNVEEGVLEKLLQEWIDKRLLSKKESL